MPTRPMLTLAACLLVLGCRDGVRPETPPAASPPLPAARMLGSFECRADAGGGRLWCAERSGDAEPLAVSRTLLGRNQVKLVSTNLRYDTLTQVFGADVTVQNLLSAPIGTPDGVGVSGVKVFFERGPTVTEFYAPGDTGTVTVHNADGAASFTGPKQPYHLYPQILQPGQVSAVKRWEWRVPRTVKYYTFSVRVFTATPGETPVPAEAPDTVPGWVYASYDWGPTPCEGRAVRNVLTVVFRESATREERQAAIDLVNGQVVGGSLGGRAGIYYVRISDDGTGAPVCQAERTLRALPQVSASFLILPSLPADHLAPNDGAGFERWQIQPGMADSANWALERIAAPLAWGCETGRDDVPIAIVDRGFLGVPDLLANATHWDDANGFPADSGGYHGTYVSSVAAAQGDNDAGISGVMWNADLRLLDIRRAAGGQIANDLEAQLDRIVHAARGGARVINYSFGHNWKVLHDRAPLLHTHPDSVAEDHRRVRRIADRLKVRLDLIRPTGALLVLTAGNNSLDAYWNGFPQVAGEPGYRDQVIVVAGTDRRDHIYTVTSLEGSGRNVEHDFVEVAAPGAEVYTIIDSTAVRPIYGTSYAAPQVTGVAGLLFSFDPRLTAAEVKRLIVQGAIRGGRTAGGIPILNAYESLKLAAERPGAPLCGNRVWNDGGTVHAQRGLLPGSPVDSLFSVRADADWVQALHGGKRIWLWNDEDQMWEWQASGRWSRMAAPPPFYVAYGPTFRSSAGESHDGDTLASVVTREGGRLDVEFRTRDGQQARAPIALPVSLPASGSTQCLRRRHERAGEGPRTVTCRDSVFIGSLTSTFPKYAAYPPHGDTLLASVGLRDHLTALSGDWYLCPGQTDPESAEVYHTCRDYTETLSEARSTVFAVSLRGGSASALLSLAGVKVNEMAFADGRDEFALRVQGVSGGTWTHAWEGPNPGDLKARGSGGALGLCETQFRALSSPGAVAHRVAIPACREHQVTIAPDRLASSARAPTETGWAAWRRYGRLVPTPSLL